MVAERQPDWIGVSNRDPQIVGEGDQNGTRVSSASSGSWPHLMCLVGDTKYLLSQLSQVEGGPPSPIHISSSSSPCPSPSPSSSSHYSDAQQSFGEGAEPVDDTLFIPEDSSDLSHGTSRLPLSMLLVGSVLNRSVRKHSLPPCQFLRAAVNPARR